jgi:hypothetical protein
VNSIRPAWLGSPHERGLGYFSETEAILSRGEPARERRSRSRRAKPAGNRAIPGRRADGWSRNGRKSSGDNQGDPPGSSGVHGATRPKHRPAGVRASAVAGKRVTTVERRDAGKWMRERRDERNQTDGRGGGNVA